MPGSTGPDLNTYTIPEVQLGDTFNVWRDASNTAIYKLNKLKVYDANIDPNAASIGATYTTAGVWNAFLQPTVTSGHTFSNLIRFTSGISANGGFTFGGTVLVVGGVSMSDALTVGYTTTLNSSVVLGKISTDQITANGVFVNGLTASGAIRANAGATASTLDVTGAARIAGGLSASALYASTGSTFAAAVVVGGGLSASALYASAGSTFGSTLYVGGGVTFASVSDYSGAARFSGGLSASALYASTGSTFGSTLYVGGGLSASGLYASTGSTFAAAVAVVGGLSASALYASTGSTFGSTVYVGGGATFAGTTDHIGTARFGGAVTLLSASNNLGTPSTLVGTNITGTASAFTASNVTTNANLTGAVTSSGNATSLGTFTAAALATALSGNTTGSGNLVFATNPVLVTPALGTPASGNLTNCTFPTLNQNTTGNAATVTTAAQPAITSVGTLVGITVGSVLLQAQASLKFGDGDSSHWVGFQAPATVSPSVVWTLPAADGSSGQVLSTNGSSTLAWKAADGVTGSDKQIQFNIGGLPGATAGLVFEYNTAGGFSAGTLGVSGGAYIMGNVGIGITTPAMGRRILPGTETTAKLEVRGDICIPSGGFFVNKNITIPAGASVGIAADENAFLSGVLTITSGATLSIVSGGTLIIL